MKPLFAIVLLAALTCLVGYLLPLYRALDFFALLLVFIAAIYVGVALAVSSLKIVMIQAVVALAFVAVAILGLWESPLWLVGGYFAHGLWDALHHWYRQGLALPRWYASACLVYDWLVGGFILYIWY